MKPILKIIFSFSILILFICSSYSQKVEPKELADGTLYGAELDASLTPTAMKDILAAPENFEKKTVVVEANIYSVCQEMGCWTVISDGTNEIRAMTLHKFFMPKDLKSGSKAVVQGEFQVKEITEEQAKEYDEESGKPSSKEIKEPQKMFMLKMTGIKILK